MFADPFSSIGLVIDTKMHSGFEFEVRDLKANQAVRLRTPEDHYDLLMLIGAPHRFVVREVYSREMGEIAAAS